MKIVNRPYDKTLCLANIKVGEVFSVGSSTYIRGSAVSRHGCTDSVEVTGLQGGTHSIMSGDNRVEIHPDATLHLNP